MVSASAPNVRRPPDIQSQEAKGFEVESSPVLKRAEAQDSLSLIWPVVDPYLGVRAVLYRIKPLLIQRC